jgi:hypothetical protein
MRHLLIPLVFTMAGICIPGSPDAAAPAADLAMIENGAPDPAIEPPSNPEPDQAALPGPTGADGDSTSGPSTSVPGTPAPSTLVSIAPAANDPSPSSDNPPGDPPTLPPSREELCGLLASAAEDNALPVAFFVRLIWQESAFDRMSVSSAGARGVAQFMPEVAQELGVRDPFDPREALPASAHLLRDLQAKFGNLGLAAAAYNAGPKRVLDWLAKRSGLPKETRNYVQIITGVPADRWIKAKLEPGELEVPRRVPCAQVASSSELPSRSQGEKPAGSHLRHRAHPAVEYMRAASPSLPPSAKPTRLARRDIPTPRDHRGAAVVRVADLKTHAKRGRDKHRAS